MLIAIAVPDPPEALLARNRSPRNVTAVAAPALARISIKESKSAVGSITGVKPFAARIVTVWLTITLASNGPLLARITSPGSVSFCTASTACCTVAKSPRTVTVAAFAASGAPSAARSRAKAEKKQPKPDTGFLRERDETTT